jgi:hypothetical protein
MLKSRNFQIVGTIALIIAATLATISAVNAPAAAPVDLSWPPRPDFSILIQKTIIPVNGNLAHGDIYARHPEFNRHASAVADLSDYALRHQDLDQQYGKVELWDMFLFHPYARKAR